MEVTVTGRLVKNAILHAARVFRCGKDTVILQLPDTMERIVVYWEVQSKLGIVQIYLLAQVSRSLKIKTNTKSVFDKRVIFSIAYSIKALQSNDFEKQRRKRRFNFCFSKTGKTDAQCITFCI